MLRTAGWRVLPSASQGKPLSMHDVPEAEALALLTVPMVCEDPGEWIQQKQPKDRVSIRCGLMNEEGINIRLLLDFEFRRSPKTKIARYIFTIFKITRTGQHRVYQLDVENFKHPPKNSHNHPHEHVGDQRIEGTQEWLAWSYPEVLEQFCRRTHVRFIPAPPSDPEAFTLKG